MQFSEMITEVFTRLDENQSAPVYWSLTDIKAALNEGLDELADASEYYKTSQSINLVADATYYDLLALFTREPLLVTAVFNPQTSRWLFQTNVDRLDGMTYARWGTVTGEPEHHFFRGLWKMGLFPKHGASSGTVEAEAAAMPPAMVADADKPGFPADFHYGCVEHAIYSLLAEDGEMDESLAHFKEYKSYEAGLIEWVQSRARSDRTGVVGG